jgi:hypothetical protein
MAKAPHRPVIAASPAPSDHAGVARGTRIVTARGLIPVEALVPGDAVLGAPGRQAPVAAVRPHGAQPTLGLRVQGGYELVAAPARPIRGLDRHGDDVWRPLGDLQPEDVVVLQPGRGLPADLPYHPLPPCPAPHGNNHQTLRTPALAEETFAYALGYLVGNGSLGYGRVSWSTNLRDVVVAEELAVLAEHLFGIAARPRPPHNGARDWHLYSTPLVAWLLALGVAKDRVPAFLWQSRASVVAAFLRGYFSADGSASDDPTGRVSIASSRPRIIAEVQALLLALGIPASRRTQPHVGPGKRHTAYSLCVVAGGLPAFARQIGFAVPRHQATLEALLCRWTGKRVFGGLPHQRDKVRALRPSGEVRRLLNNTSSQGRPVSPALAARVAALDPTVAAALGLHRLLRDGQLFLRVQRVTPAGLQETYGLDVPGAQAWVSAGFLSGQPAD